MTGDYLCKFLTGGGFIWMSATASGILLMATAKVRYFAVVHPLLRTFRLNNRHVLWIMAVSWGFAILLAGPSLSSLVYDPKRDFCVEDWAEWYPARAQVAFVFVVNYIVPITAMILLYARIIFNLWCNQDQITNSVQIARLKARRSTTLMLINLTVVHALCWTPNYVFYFLIYHGPVLHYGSRAYNITVLLVLVKAAADPMLCTWYLDGFKRGIHSAICCCHRNRVTVLGGKSPRKNITTKPAELGISAQKQNKKDETVGTSHLWPTSRNSSS